MFEIPVLRMGNWIKGKWIQPHPASLHIPRCSPSLREITVISSSFFFQKEICAFVERTLRTWWAYRRSTVTFCKYFAFDVIGPEKRFALDRDLHHNGDVYTPAKLHRLMARNVIWESARTMIMYSLRWRSHRNCVQASDRAYRRGYVERLWICDGCDRESAWCCSLLSEL